MLKSSNLEEALTISDWVMHANKPRLVACFTRKVLKLIKSLFVFCKKKVALCLKEEQGGILVYCGIKMKPWHFIRNKIIFMLSAVV